MPPMHPRAAALAGACLTMLLLAGCDRGVKRELAARLILRADGFPAPATIHVPRRITPPMAFPTATGTQYTQEMIAAHDHPTGLMVAAGLVRAQDVVTMHQKPIERRDYSSRIDGGFIHGYEMVQPPPTYTHRIEITRRGADEATERDWAPDTDAEHAREFARSGHTPGWEVTVARPEVIEVGKFESGLGDPWHHAGTKAARVTWRWQLTPSGAAFDQGGPIYDRLTANQREFARRFHGGLDPRAVHHGVAYFKREGKRWTVVKVELGDDE